MATVFDLINGSYVTIFNRAADPQGALFWSQSLGFSSIGAASGSLATIAQANQLGANFYAAASTVFNTLYPTTLSDSAFINQLYLNLGGLPPDGAGANFWVNRLNFLETQTPNSQVARAQVAGEIAFVLQTFDPNATGDAKIRAQTFQNKILVSETLVNTGNPVFNPASQSLSDPAYLGATNILVGVTDTSASVAVAQAQIAAANTANNPALLVGQQLPLTLTINVDTLTTSFNDAVFTAPPGQNVLGPSNTLQVGDSLTDTGTNGTLNYTAVASLLGNPALAAGVTMNGIVNANILNTSAGVAGFSGNITGLTTANMQAGSNGNVLLGLASAGLNTALANIGISADSNFTAWIAAAALSGAANSVNVNLHGNDSSLDLLVTGGGDNGYETATISSADGNNIFDFDVNYTSLNRINVVGDRNLTMGAGSTALNLANLAIFDGSAATGILDITFNGAGDVIVDGGSNNDLLTFPAGNGAGAVTVRGNAGDDTITFLTNGGGTTTFTANDNVDGGAGVNLLVLEADTGEILVAGDTPATHIVNIQTIRHVQNGAVTSGTITANMANSGSANVLDLAGQYGGNDVSVTNLITAKSVLFSGDNIDDLDLDATSLLGQVNLTMAQTATGGTQNINDLDVTVGNLLNLTSGGNATTNLIGNVAGVDANVSIAGAHQLNFGFLAANAKATNAANAYDFDGGIIDATALTGALSIGLDTGKQQLALGVGNDVVHIWTAGADANAKLLQLGTLAGGGNDIVQFHDVFDDASDSIVPNTLATINYTLVQGFNVANDVIQIDAGSGAFEVDIEETNATGVFNPPAIFNYSLGTNPNLSGLFIDMIKIDTAIGAFSTPDALFDAAIGANTITVNPATNGVLFAVYSNDFQAMTLFVIDGPGATITAADDVDVVGVISMSFADFQTFGTNGSLAFV